MMPDHVHGTDAGYQRGCHCGLCMEARRIGNRADKARLPVRPRMLPIHVRAPQAVAFYADLFAVTFTAARQLLDGEVNVDDRNAKKPRTVVDRWRREHRMGVRP